MWCKIDNSIIIHLLASEDLRLQQYSSKVPNNFKFIVIKEYIKLHVTKILRCKLFCSVFRKYFIEDQNLTNFAHITQIYVLQFSLYFSWDRTIHLTVFICLTFNVLCQVMTKFEDLKILFIKAFLNSLAKVSLLIFYVKFFFMINFGLPSVM